MMRKNSFKPVNPQVNFPQLEEEVIKYWKENKIFEKSLEKEAPKGDWTFVDGPPFITGLPHYGSLLISIPKDIFPRYKTMNGYFVRRIWGWDCHGLPAENKVEEKLGLESKRDIEEKIGVRKFIEECKLYVKDVSAEWEWYVDHIGRWVNFKDAYRTMDLPYMESVMWVFKQMYDKGHIYKGLRVSLYCPHDSTPISNFEVAMDADNYKEVPDAATTYKYKIEKDTYILAWSTTPWNKIVTVALAVNPELTYVKVKQGKEFYVLAKSTIKMLEGKYEIVEQFKGSSLVGVEFEPHYDYYREKILPNEKAFEIIPGDFVTADEGTGVVTIAVYGEEDLKAIQQNNIHIEMHLDDEGTIKADVPNFGGMYYLKANKAVNDDLQKRGLIYKDEEVAHKVPLCWRCHTRLYYAPQNAWYINVQSLKPKLKETNEVVNFFPSHFKYGRYLKSLENAPDWCISRSRYWGSPVPVWECPDGHRTVPGSIKELEQLSGEKINDLHKPDIDEVKIKCGECGKEAKRTPEVLDSWIEAGSAPYAERHYPFEEKDLDKFFPPDFITEYTGQIRAWFYVLHVISTALFDKNAFKNVLVTGVILGTDGRKMSKNYKNYPDPKELIQKYGGDALRLYLMSSPVMHGEDALISEEQYRNQVKGLMLIYWNVYNFFVTNASVDNWQPEQNAKVSDNVLDRWIISRLNNNIKSMTETGYEKFDPIEIVNHMSTFMDNLSLWYIRRTRDRVGVATPNSEDKDNAYQTMWHVLTTYTKALAPMIPFITEEIYRNLTGEESVHLTSWPSVHEEAIDDTLEKQMTRAQEIASLAHGIRKEKAIKVRQPLSVLEYDGQKLPAEIEQIIAQEVNVKEVKNAKSTKLDLKITPQLQAEGEARDIIRQIQIARKEASCNLNEKVSVKLPSWPKEFEQQIKNETLTDNLIEGETLEVVRTKQNAA